MSVIGARVRRLEDRALLVGAGRYVDDLATPGTLHVAFARSPHAHALVRGIDARAARALDGVASVLTLDDLRPMLRMLRLPRNPQATRQPEGSTPYLLAHREVA